MTVGTKRSSIIFGIPSSFCLRKNMVYIHDIGVGGTATPAAGEVRASSNLDLKLFWERHLYIQVKLVCAVPIYAYCTFKSIDPREEMSGQEWPMTTASQLSSPSPQNTALPRASGPALKHRARGRTAISLAPGSRRACSPRWRRGRCARRLGRSDTRRVFWRRGWKWPHRAHRVPPGCTPARRCGSCPASRRRLFRSGPTRR